LVGFGGDRKNEQVIIIAEEEKAFSQEKKAVSSEAIDFLGREV